MRRKKLLWVCVTFNLLYERERGREEGRKRGKEREEGEGREEEWREETRREQEEERRRKTVRSNFSRKLQKVWELLSVLCDPLTVSGRVGSVTS